MKTPIVHNHGGDEKKACQGNKPGRLFALIKVTGLPWITGVGLLCLLCSAGLSTTTHAHEARPVFLQISEQETGSTLRWSVPPSVAGTNIPGPVLTPDCRPAETPLLTSRGGTFTGTQTLLCEGGLAGKTITLSYPLYNPSLSAVIRITFLNGSVMTRTLGPEESSWHIPRRQTAFQLILAYTQLGIYHIAEGYDHLLFVACLLFIAGSWRRILIVITGFTLAHSLTLALSTLNILHIPLTPVEAVIALSIVFLATELVRENRQTLTWRMPVVVSTGFGLLHGFGFASALREIGLPEEDRFTALFSFNLGIEAGQILFAAAAIGVMGCMKWTASRVPALHLPGEERLQARAIAYIAGPLASYWLIERITGL